MCTRYDSEEKVWSAPENDIEYCGLGQAILTKLKKDDPKRILEVHHESGTQLTVEDIYRQTITVASNLMRLGVEQGDSIVLYSASNQWTTPISFACYTIGAPVNFFETHLVGGDVEEIIERIDPTVIIFEEHFRSTLFGALKNIKLQKLKHVLGLGTEEPSAIADLFNATVDVDSFEVPDIGDPFTKPATLMLTSGSTGVPKVIVHSHAMMMQGIVSWWNQEPGDVILCFSPLRWISQVSIMLLPVFFSVKRICTSEDPSGPLGRLLIDTYKITKFFTVPGVYSDILKEADNCGSSLNSLRIALTGGEVVPESLIANFARIAPNCKAVPAYGMTELAGCVASCENINKHGVNGGSLIIGFMAKIIDDHQKALGPNHMGLLCIKHKVPFLQYLKNDKANEESFLEGGWLNTGDYAYIDYDNLLNIVTRYKFLVRSGATVVIPTYVENTLMEHPSVMSCALVGHPDPKHPADEIGTAFVVLKPGADLLKIDELAEMIKQKLSKEQNNVVRHIRVIPEMPWTTCGKINRPYLSEMASEMHSKS